MIFNKITICNFCGAYRILETRYGDGNKIATMIRLKNEGWIYWNYFKIWICKDCNPKIGHFIDESKISLVVKCGFKLCWHLYKDCYAMEKPFRVNANILKMKHIKVDPSVKGLCSLCHTRYNMSHKRKINHEQKEIPQ